MTGLAYLDRFGGVISRYEIGGQLRRTHTATLPDDFPRPVLFDAGMVEDFRKGRFSEFYCGPLAPVPGGNNPGGTPMAMAA